MSERVLTLRELNRATLSRQLLLERRRLSVPKAIERLAGLQAQWPPSPYVALWSRLEGFERDRLTRALLRRQVVKATAMRITLHLLSAGDYILFAGALKAPWVAQLTRRMERMGVEVDVPALAEQALALMADGPRSRSEVLRVFGSTGEQPWFVWTLVQAELGLVRTPESAIWRRTVGPVSYVPARAWLGRQPDTEPRALVHLVRRYLAAFGPASRADLAQWSGLPSSAVAPALDALEPLRRFRDERGRELLDLPRLPLPGPDVRAPVRFLPQWDSSLLAYDVRERILPEAHRKTVIQRNGDVRPTFLVDGFVAGTWRERQGRVELEPFEPLPRAARRDLETEAKAPGDVPRVSERVLTQRELNRALLARQLLLERARLPIARAVERMGGIQNQYAPNAYIRLWSSLDGFRRDDLTRALQRRSVIQGTLMRETIHVVSRADYPLFAAGIRVSGQEWWRRVNKVPQEVDMEAFSARARAFFRGTTRTRAEVEQFLREHDFARASLWGFAHWIDLVRVPPAGTWEQRRAHTFALAEEWVGPLDASEEEGIEHLARRYLGAFGPASQADIAQWCKVPAAKLKPALARLELRRFRNEEGKELVDLPRASLPDPDTPAPVRFLPTWDAALLVHARRTGILPEPYRKIIFDVRKPQSMPTFLVDGAVAGAWHVEKGRVVVEPYTRLSRSVRKEVDEEAERLSALHH